MNDDNNLIDLTVNERNLIHALETWFESIEDEYKVNKNFWKRNKVAALLKLRLKGMKKWKNGSDSQRQPRDCDFKKKTVAPTNDDFDVYFDIPS